MGTKNKNGVDVTDTVFFKILHADLWSRPTHRVDLSKRLAARRENKS